jgi:hypothetical protein
VKKLEVKPTFENGKTADHLIRTGSGEEKKNIHYIELQHYKVCRYIAKKFHQLMYEHIINKKQSNLMLSLLDETLSKLN